MTLKVACIQMDIAFGNPERNYVHADKLIRQAAADKPDVLLLPELWTTGYDLEHLGEIGDQEASRTSAFISQLAKQQGIHIIAGSIAKKTTQGITNTMNLAVFTLYTAVSVNKEHRYLLPGQSNGLFTLDGTLCAGAICYDIRFPERIRLHTVKGAILLFVSAEWPLPRLSHWRALLISRAIENQCFVVACNRTGSDPANRFAGHSMIIDPWGTVLAEAGEGEETIHASLDLKTVDDARQRIPVFSDRRPELYSN